MKPVTTVLSLPVTDLDRSARFYRDGLGLAPADPDGGVVAVELPNLSLFLIERDEFETYLDRAGVPGRPRFENGACILSAAIATRDEIERVVSRAISAGGTAEGPAEHDGSFTAYVRDPDGHVWELVHNEHTAEAGVDVDPGDDEA
ncbi:VOC family protein [Microbacterium sp.]|uniref:VOC family protein n=1 Tax=Microbacterium sp. TaxID=51671 RepID=UPI002810F9DC|nr:VOC family protein [Microbacterium sp.]